MKLLTTTKKAKGIIRRELLNCSVCLDYKQYGFSTKLEALKHQADIAYHSSIKSNYKKMINLVNCGFFLCYPNQQAKFLSKFYEKSTIEKWLNRYNKIHETYAHLLAREYEAMCREKKL